MAPATVREYHWANHLLTQGEVATMPQREQVLQRAHSVLCWSKGYPDAAVRERDAALKALQEMVNEFKDSV
jgi:hypothetical protein